MKTLKLGDKFNTKNVKDMYKMFLDCGYTEMITIDLGPAFVYIPSSSIAATSIDGTDIPAHAANEDMFSNTGKSGSLTIYAPSSIYLNAGYFRNSLTSTAITEVTTGTINPKYKTEWIKTESTLDVTNKKITITLRGQTNAEAGTDYISDVTETVDSSNVKVLFDGSAATNLTISKTKQSATNITTGANDVIVTVTITGLTSEQIDSAQIIVAMQEGNLKDKWGNVNLGESVGIRNELRNDRYIVDSNLRFLKMPDTERENIDNITFLDNLQDINIKTRLDAQNNTGIGHNTSSSTWKDLSGNSNGILYGPTWGEDYLKFDGEDDFVCFRPMNFTDKATFDITMSINEIQSGSKAVFNNFEVGGLGLALVDGKPSFSVYINEAGKYIEANSSTPLTVGQKTRIVGTYDGEKVCLYVDGELVASTTQKGTIKQPEPNVPVVIGGNIIGGKIATNENVNMNVYSAAVYDKVVWDVSAKRDNSILGWTQEQSNGTKKIYVGSDGVISTNKDSGELFAYVGYSEKCTATETITNIGLLDTSGTTNMNSMFYHTGYNAMTKLELGDNFDTSNVTNMENMFRWTGYKNMSSLDLGTNFDTSNVTRMDGMFSGTGYTTMTDFKLGDKFNTVNVTNMSEMFKQTGYNLMTELDLGNNFNTSKVTDMSKMFEGTGYKKMTTLNLGSDFDTSNVTDMSNMFSITGYKSMQTLDLGTKFNTSNVTNMQYMFGDESIVNFDTSALKELKLGDKFYTNKVTNMYRMFYRTGNGSLTNLDLGPAFTKIPDGDIEYTLIGNTEKHKAYEDMFKDTGMSGSLTIQAPEAIFQDKNNFKLNTNATTAIVNVSTGTIAPKYRTEWVKENTTIDTTNKNIKITLRGRTNPEAGTEYVSDVKSSLKVSNIKIWIDGTDITDLVNKDLSNTATSVTNEITKALDVQQVVTLSNFEAVSRIEGKSYNEWSGNITVEIEQVTLKDTTYGNGNVLVTSAGERENSTISTEKVSANTNGSMFTDFIRPEIQYVYSNGNIDYDKKTLTVEFSVIDKYFSSTTLSDFDASAIMVKLKDTNQTIPNEKITKNLTYVSDVNETRDGQDVKIGEKYRLVIGGLQQETTDGNYRDYSGPMSIIFPEKIVTDNSGNQNTEKIITIGVNTDETTDDSGDSSSTDGVIVDVVDPVWKAENIIIDKANKKATVDLIGTDKYLQSSSLSTGNIKVFVDGNEITDTQHVTKSLSGATALTETRDGISAQYGVKYTLTLSNWNAGILGNNDYEEYSGITKIAIAENTLTDQSNNKSEKQEFNLGQIDVLNPLGTIESRSKDLKAKTATFKVKITDKYFEKSTLTSDTLQVLVDGVNSTDGITKDVTEKELTTTINGISKQYGVEYTITVSGYPTDKKQVKIRIPEGVVTDTSGNKNPNIDNVLYSTLKSASTETRETSGFLGNKNIQRQNIDKIGFAIVKQIAGNNTNWDVSELGDNSIVAFINNDSEVIIESEGDIYANSDSSYLFAYIGSSSTCTDTKTIYNLDLLNTTFAANMEGMFKNTGSNAMTSLDLGDNFDTSNVTKMNNMFEKTGSNAMISLNLGTGFDTSNVTSMNNMFAECGLSAMTSLTLGNKFNTKNVTDMSYMFFETGGGMTSLDLGDNFYTSKVTDMEAMFFETGYGKMTSLDLGPAFTNMVEDTEEFIFGETGKNGNLTIYASEAIYKNKRSFKKDENTDTLTNTVTTGTIEPKYRTEWVKESTTVDTTNKNMQITLRGRTNAEAGKDYISDVTSSLAVGNIKVLVDGTDISSSISKTLGTATQVTNTTTGAKDVLQTLTLSGFEQSKILSSKRYKDWSGNITIQVAQGTLKDNTYGNKNTAITSAGARTDHTLSDAVVNKNTASTLFTDYISPSVIFKNSETVIDKTNKTYKMIFDVTDKYYDTTYADLTLADLTIKIGGEVPDWNSKEVIRSLNSSAITATVDGASKTVGKRYTLTLSNLEQLQIKQGDNYLDYSGVITVAIPAGKAADYSGNKNVATTVTSGIDLPGGSGTGTVVDVVQPFFEKINSSVDATNKTATLEFSVTDKYFKASTLTRDNIKVFINGTETTSGITKTLSSESLTEDRAIGSTTTKFQYGVKYKLTITGFDSEVNQIKVKIPAGLVTDSNSNSNEEKEYIIYNVLKAQGWFALMGSGFLGSDSSTNEGVKAIQRENIDNITFVNSTTGKNTNTWDVSAQGDNSILAWYTQNSNGSYKVYIGSDSEIFGNRDSSSLFEYIGNSDKCTATETITNINLLNTSNVTNMSSMFFSTGSKAMTSLDLGDNFDTGNVTDMSSMFGSTGFDAMTSLKLGSKFNTNKVTDMSRMFSNTGYSAMTSLNLGDKFDTSSVTDMSEMFSNTGHKAMISLDLGDKFDTSNVTNMNKMFYNTGNSAMTSLDLGDKFDTSNVTNMNQMFYCTGYRAMTSLKLGNKFNTSKVTDMRELFYMTGANVMTILDLGPAFTKIATGSLPNKWDSSKTEEANVDMFSLTGKYGAVIYAPEAIFQDKNNFKLNASATTGTINCTGRTIEPKYRTEWVKEGTTVDTTNKNIQIKLRGRTNAEAGTDYVSDVTSSLAVGNIKILVDGTDITSIVTKTLGTASQTTNATTGAKDVLQTLTLSNFAEATRRTGKSYKEWSGNITVEVAQKTLTDTTYGNKNMALTSAGARANNTIADTTKVDKNTAGSMFADVIKPEITYVYSSGNINQTNKTLTVDFSVVDKYFSSAKFTKLADGSYDASAIKVTLKDTNTQIPDAKITKKLTYVSDVNETRDGQSVKIGEKYRLVIGGLEQVDSNGLTDGTTYSGPMSVTFPEGIGVDKSSNKNPSTTITIGVNEPGGSSSNQQVVDVVDPVWTKTSVDISTGTIKLRVKDKYLGVPGALDASKIKVLVNGVESTVATKTITGPTQITANQEYEYTLKLGNISSGGGGYVEFTPIDAIIGGKAKYRAENGGNVTIEIAQGAISDKYGNKTKKQSFDIGNTDSTSPEVYDIQKTIDATNHKATFVFNVTDKNYDESDLVATNELTVWMDGTQIDSKVTKTITKTTAIKTTIDGATKTVGHQYTLEISGIRESDLDFKSAINEGTREYRELSGTLEIKINESAAKDLNGNTLNPDTTTLKNFVDTLKPEVTYKFATSNIDKTNKTFTMVFDMVDKYYNASTSTQLTINDLTIKIDGEVPDWTKVTKALAVTDISKTISVTDPGNASGTIKSITKTIGKRYTLTLSNLEQLQIKEGDNYLDYSGVVTVGIPANKMADTNGTKNSATTITSGVQIPGGSGAGTVVDVVQPLVKKESSSAYAVEQTATLKFNVTDKYFKASTISESNIKVFVNGTETTSGITKKLTSTNLTEDRVSGSTTTKVQYGVDYTLTITGFVSNANQLKVRIPAGLVTDSNGNSNKQTDFMVYNALKSTAAESAETNGFLGSASSSNTGIKAIQRQNIDNVTFVNSTSGKNSNNWDVSAQGDGSILAWYTQNANGSYKVYIGSDWEMFGNYNSTNLFANIGKSSKSTSATTITNIDLLNVGSVVVMEAMFKNTGYNAMTKLDLGSNFNTGHATTMNQMFQGTGYTAMTTLSLGSNFDTTNVTNMHQMFNQTGYTKMTSLNLGTKFNTSKAESMRYMFCSTGHTAMTTLTLESNFDTSNVTDMTGMFQDTGYTAMTSLDLGTKFNTSKVQHMGSMFRATGNGALSSINLGSNFDTSNVLDMDYMFFGLGFTNMESLNLGTKFNTAKVTNMEHMFHNTGFTKLTSLDLGDKFSMASVQNTDCMFYSTGKTAMTSLDLGPSFTSIPTNSPNMFTNTGKENGITIYATEPIFLNKNNFKLNASATTSAINYTRGTINAKYRTEWIKESVTLDTTNKNIQIELKGTTNSELAAEEYKSDVESLLTAENVKISIDGTDITDKVSIKVGTKEEGTLKEVANAKTGAKDVLQTITLLGLDETTRIDGKDYNEWSGNLAVEVEQKTLKDTTYGNKNVEVIPSGERGNSVFEDTTKVDKNTDGALFTDFIEPEFKYIYSSGDIDHLTKTLTVEFSTLDKYFDKITLNKISDTEYDASGIKVRLLDTDQQIPDSNISKKLVYESDINETRDGKSVKIGEKYKLIIGGLEQVDTDGLSDGTTYSGPMSIVFPKNMILDTSGNSNKNTKTITIGINDPENTGNQEIVDVVSPVWSLGNVDTDKNTDTGIVKLIVYDKYLGVPGTLNVDKIQIFVNGVESTKVVKSITGPREITANEKYEYTLKLSNITLQEEKYIEVQPKETIVGGTAKYRDENGGAISIRILEGAIKDKYTNSTKQQEFSVGNVDTTGPQIYDVQKTQDISANKATFIFNVTDKNYDSSDLITEDEMDIYMDKYQINNKIESEITTVTTITATVDGKEKIIGHQYTLEIRGISENDALFKEALSQGTRDYRVWSGTLRVEIKETAARDLAGNTLNTDTTTLKDFVDVSKPDVTYISSTSTIDKNNKTFTMVFDMVDKYYDKDNSADLKVDDLDIQIGDKTPDWNNEVTKALSVEDITATIPSTVPPNVNGTVQDEVTKVIGRRYTLTLSNLEQLQVKEGDKYLDYSGIITVAIPKDKMVDYSGNKNVAATITSGLDIPGGTGTGTVVDVVDPLIEKVNTSANPISKTGTLEFKISDRYLGNSTPDTTKIKILVDGTVNNSISKTLDKIEDQTETRVEGGKTSTVKIGATYKLSISGFTAEANQVKVRFESGFISDSNSNSNKETEIILYNVLKSTATETSDTSGFLGNTNIARQDVDSVTFVNSISSDVYDKSAGQYTDSTVWDVSAQGDKSIVAWYTQNANGSYTVYIGSDYEIFGNMDSSYLFSQIGRSSKCTSTETIKNLALLNTTGINKMNSMFAYTGYNAMVNLNLEDKFDTSNVTEMNNMFAYCGYNAMTDFALGDNFNTGKVTQMIGMFEALGHENLQALNLGSQFDTVKVEKMSSMFKETGFQKMGSLTLGTNFNTSNVTDMDYMFYQTGRKKLTTLNLGNSFNTSKVTNMQEMFQLMEALTNLNLGGNFDTSKVTNMYGMFWGTGYSNMTSLSLGDKFDTSQVKDMNSMFYNFAQKIKTLDLGEKFSTSQVEDMANMFNGTGASEMTVLNLGPAFTKIASGNVQNKDDASSTHNANENMFTNCGTSELTIYAPESIYATIQSFKTGK